MSAEIVSVSWASAIVSVVLVVEKSVRAGLGEFADQPFDHGKSQRPESRIARIEPEGLEQFGMVLGPPGLQQLEIALREPVAGPLILGVKRVHKAVAERIGIDIERRVDEVR